MDKAITLGIVGTVALVSGCTSSEPAQQPPPTDSRPNSTAVGVRAGPPRLSSASTPPARTATRAVSDERPTRSALRWTSGPGAPKFPTPSDVDQHSIEAVALAGATALASADTAVDANPQHTALRAAWAGWLTPDYAQRVSSAEITGPAGAQWDTWYRHRAYVVVSASPSGEDHPPDSTTTAARKVVLHERPVGRDGWRDKQMTAVVAVVLKRVNDVWRIDSDQPS